MALPSLADQFIHLVGNFLAAPSPVQGTSQRILSNKILVPLLDKEGKN